MDIESNYRQALEGIQRLHRQDLEASKKRDFDSLRALVSDEGIILPEGGNPVRGGAELDSWFAELKNLTQELEILEYVMEFQDVQIHGSYAFEWGYSHETVRNTRTGEVQKGANKLFRVLRLEGSHWKVYRSMWNA